MQIKVKDIVLDITSEGIGTVVSLHTYPDSGHTIASVRFPDGDTWWVPVSNLKLVKSA